MSDIIRRGGPTRTQILVTGVSLTGAWLRKNYRYFQSQLTSREKSEVKDFIRSGTGQIRKYLRDKISNTSSESYSTSTSSMPRRKKQRIKGRPHHLINTNEGVGGHKRQTRRKHGGGKRRVKSLKKRVKALEGKAPLYSESKMIVSEDWIAILSNNGAKRYFEIPLLEWLDIQTVATKKPVRGGHADAGSLAITGSGAADASRLHVKNMSVKFEGRNNTTNNAHVEYQLFMCKRNNSDTALISGPVLAQLREQSVSYMEGTTFAETIANEVPGAGSVSSQPAGIEFGSTRREVPYWHGNHSLENWKPMAPIVKTVLGPGDSFRVGHNTGKLIYDDAKFDIEDNEGTVLYRKGWDIRLVICLTGGLGHSTSKVGFSEASLDCYKHITGTNRLRDGYGFRGAYLNRGVSDTGLSAPVEGSGSVNDVQTTTRL